MPSSEFQFTFARLEDQYRTALDHGYQFMTCAEYAECKAIGLPPRVVVNRVDVDVSVKRAADLAAIYNRLGIKASFFIRLHGNEYNPFSFEHYRILKSLVDSGHELGYHSEVVDAAEIWDECAVDCFRRDIDVFSRIFSISLKGVASHGGFTGLNNLDFWRERRPSDFGLLYEAYDREHTFNLFHESLYVSDSEWTRWKCYNRGKLVSDDRRSFAEHVLDRHTLIYLLIHSDTYYHRHFYE